MAWYLGRGDRIICDGPCSGSKVPGFVPCPVDHDAQPFNDVDPSDGSPFYMCDTCDWVRPDPYGENILETAGMVTCPHCQNGENNGTYVGPCEEGCKRRDAGAEYRPVPDDIVAALRRKYGRSVYRTTVYACTKCFHKMCQRDRRELAAEIQAEALRIEKLAAWEEHHKKYPPGTCGICRKIRNLAVIDHENEDYVCLDCHPAWSASREQTQTDTPLDDQPQAGWYPDPENPEHYVRWWSGTEWAGPSTLPEHIHA